uniref:(California timema) hypothetical protein n=1 Tax=Timema californicum TaxID=61474 RepID=A0A7R9JHJ9_TIMCA|nr:unnamed protein product [Timema californicum]
MCMDKTEHGLYDVIIHPGFVCLAILIYNERSVAKLRRRDRRHAIEPGGKPRKLPTPPSYERSVAKLRRRDRRHAIEPGGKPRKLPTPPSYVYHYIRGCVPAHNIAIYCISALKEGLHVRHDNNEDQGVGYTATLDGMTVIQ